MRSLWVVLTVCLVLQMFYSAQAHPHRSIEDTEEDDTNEDTSSDTEQKAPDVAEPDPEPEPQPQPSPESKPEEGGGNVRELTGQSHEGDSNEEEPSTREDPDPDQDSNEEGERRNTSTSDEDDSVEFPRAEALCPARPEEIATIEQECAKEYQQWKETKAKREMATTFAPQAMMVESVSKPGQVGGTSEESMSADMKMMTTTTTTSTTTITTTEEPSTTTEEAVPTTTDMTTMTTPDDDTMTASDDAETTTTTEAATSTDVTEKTMTRRKRTVVKRKRSCYPATCILRKLKVLDSLSQLNSKQIQKFALSMTPYYGSTNLEQKAMECVKEVNDAMIDNSSDIGKKVGCVAYKVITCLNKGLTCPIIKVPQN